MICPLWLKYLKLISNQMNRDLKQLIISVLIIFILGMLFFMNQEKNNKVLNPIFKTIIQYTRVVENTD